VKNRININRKGGNKSLGNNTTTTKRDYELSGNQSERGKAINLKKVEKQRCFNINLCGDRGGWSVLAWDGVGEYERVDGGWGVGLVGGVGWGWVVGVVGFKDVFGEIGMGVGGVGSRSVLVVVF